MANETTQNQSSQKSMSECNLGIDQGGNYGKSTNQNPHFVNSDIYSFKLYLFEEGLNNNPENPFEDFKVFEKAIY